MKKFLFAFMAMCLTFTFAVISCGGDDSKDTGPKTYTVTFSRGDIPSSVDTIIIPAKITKLKKNATLTAEQLEQPAGTWFGHDWDGWYLDKTGAGDAWTDSDAITKNITLYAVYTAITVPDTDWLVMLDPNGGTLADRYVTVTKGTALGTEYKTPTRAGYTFDGWFLDTTEYTASTPNVTGGITLVAKWTRIQVTVTFNYNYTATETGETVKPADVVKTIYQLDPLADTDWPSKPVRANTDWVFDGWGETATAVVAVDKDKTYSAAAILYAMWRLPTIEKVTLANGFYAVYRFELPSGYTWEDYSGITADYKVEDYNVGSPPASIWTAGNSAGGTRMHFNYQVSDLTFVDINVSGSTVKKAVADFNAGKNTAYCLDAGKTSWGTIKTFAANWVPADAADGFEYGPGDWFTAKYDISGASKSGDWQDVNMPALTAEGPFYCALGIAGRGVTTVQFIRDVTLVGYKGVPNVIATPAIFEDSETAGDIYPAFIGYPDTSGDNGAREAAREIIATTPVSAAIPTIPVTFVISTVTLDPSFPTVSVATTGWDTDKEMTTDRNSLLSSTQLAAPGLRVWKTADPLDGFYNFTGWVTALTDGSSVTTGTKFLTATTIYGTWSELITLPLPAAPLVLEEGDFTVLLDSGKQLGTGSGGALIVIPLPMEELNKALYDGIEVTYEIEDYTPVAPGDPAKLIFKAAANGNFSDWSSIGNNSESYHDRTADGEYTWEYDLFPGFTHIKVQDNSDSKASFKFTITKIEFTSFDYAPVGGDD